MVLPEHRRVAPAFTSAMQGLESNDGAYAPTPSTDARYHATLRVTVVGALVDVTLGTAKLAAGIAGSSHALVADGIHSISDLVTDGVVLLGARQASAAADEDHPYGHARVETVVTVLLGISLLGVAVAMAVSAVSALVRGTGATSPEPWALVVAIASIAAKEASYRYTHEAAEQHRSDLLEANAWHHRSDALSSVGVVVGVGGAMLGLGSLDAIAALGVSVMLFGVGGRLGWDGLCELVDTGLEPARVDAIGSLIGAERGVLALRRLRTRRMGPHALVDASIAVDGRLSVSEGHRIAERVRARLVARFDDVVDVTVQVEPAVDERGVSTRTGSG